MLFFPVWKGAFYAWCAQVPQRARAFHADCASNELKEVEIMTITVSGRKMPVTDALRQYAEEKVGNAIKAVDADTVSTEIVLYTEKNPANPLPAICEVTVRVKGHIVRVEESEEDMYAAIDVAAAKVARQLRKYKTRVLDKKVRATERIVDYAHEDAHPESELDLDRLMDELSEDEKLTVNRARKVQRFLSQPFHVAEQFTGMEGKYVPIKETIRGFREIIEGKHDDLPESAFLFAVYKFSHMFHLPVV